MTKRGAHQPPPRPARPAPSRVVPPTPEGVRDLLAGRPEGWSSLSLEERREVVEREVPSEARLEAERREAARALGKPAHFVPDRHPSLADLDRWAIRRMHVRELEQAQQAGHTPAIVLRSDAPRAGRRPYVAVFALEDRSVSTQALDAVAAELPGQAVARVNLPWPGDPAHTRVLDAEGRHDRLLTEQTKERTQALESERSARGPGRDRGLEPDIDL